MDVSTLLIRALHDVFGENDAARRRAALGELFHEDAVFAEVGAGVHRGHAAIDGFVGSFRSAHPDLRYQVLGDPEVIGDGGRVRWTSGRPGEPPAVAGSDFIVTRAGRIAGAYLFFDPLPAARDSATGADGRSK